MTKEISSIIDYPIDKNGHLVTRRSGLTRMKPKLDAPPAGQPGSVDWTMVNLFGSRSEAINMIESLVAGQGENADEKWIRFILLYRQWEIQFKNEELDDPPTLNQVCHALNFDAGIFLQELQMGLQSLMANLARSKASMAVPDIMEAAIRRAKLDEADIKERELPLRIAGIIDQGGGVNVQINNQQNTAILNKGDKDRQRAPLLQFSEIVEAIDDEVRKDG